MKASPRLKYSSAPDGLLIQCITIVVRTYSSFLFRKAVSLSARIVTGDLSNREGYDIEQLKSIAKVQVRRSAFIGRRVSANRTNSSPPSFMLLGSIYFKHLIFYDVTRNDGVYTD